MGIQVSIHNDTEYDPIKGEVLLLGGAKFPSQWSFELSPGELISKKDQGISASCPYDLIVYIPNFDKTGKLKRISHRFKAPSSSGNLNIYIQDVIVEAKKKAIQESMRIRKNAVKKGGRIHESQSPARRKRRKKGGERVSLQDQRLLVQYIGILIPIRHWVLLKVVRVYLQFLLSVLKKPLDKTAMGESKDILSSPTSDDDQKSSNASLPKHQGPDAFSENLNKRRERLRLEQQSTLSWILNDVAEWAAKDLTKTILTFALMLVFGYWIIAWLNDGGISLAVPAVIGAIGIALFHPRQVLPLPACLPGVPVPHKYSVENKIHNDNEQTIVGWMLTVILRYTALNGFPMDFKTVHLGPSIWGNRLYLSILAMDVGFGNPPDFPHQYFVKCKKVSLQLSMKLTDLVNLARWTSAPWSPFPSECRKIIGAQDGTISWHVEGVGLLPPGHRHDRKCYIKVKVGEKTLKKTELLKSTPENSFDFGVIQIPYRNIRHRDKITLTVWEKSHSGGSKTFRGETRLSIEDIKACGAGKHGKSHTLYDKKGTVYVDAWRKANGKGLDGRGLISLHLQANLNDDVLQRAGWGVWESNEFLRPYCLIYDGKKLLKETKICPLQGKEHPKWGPITLNVQDLSADSVLRFEVCSHGDGPSGGALLGTAKLPLHVIASKKSTHLVPLHNILRPPQLFSPVESRKFRLESVIPLPRRGSQSFFLNAAHKQLPAVDDSTAAANDTAAENGDDDTDDDDDDDVDDLKRSHAVESQPGKLTIRVRKKGNFKMPVPEWDKDNKNGVSALRISSVRTTFLASKPAFLGVADIDHIEFDTVMLNFETHQGEFNVNGVTRMIAEGEMAAAVNKQIPPPFNWPNCLKVRIIRARNLRTHSGRDPSPRVIVSVRRQKASTLGHQLNTSPLFDETFKFVVTDPSAVLHVAIQSQGMVKASYIGHWVSQSVRQSLSD
eukprot:jgi/Bigna1/68516/fgenesh1_pg.6_\